jgi:hypothetical protein
MAHKQTVYRKWESMACLEPDWHGKTFLQQFAEKGWTREKLLEFFNDTKDLSWPEFYGESPWGGTFSVAYAMVNGTGSDYYLNHGKVYKDALTLVN